jgi:calpain-15
VGDCWLLAALACLAEYPEAIKSIFADDLEDPNIDSQIFRSVRMFHPGQRAWMTVTVDDWANPWDPILKCCSICPCCSTTDGKLDLSCGICQLKGIACPELNETDSNSAMMAKPNGAELWVVTLEKAFAKFCGSFNALDGGQVLWALHVLTGAPVYQYHEKNGSWHEDTLLFPQCAVGRNDALPVKDPKRSRYHDAKGMFDQLLSWDRSHYMMFAGRTSSAGEEKRDDGIVAGHAYALMRVVEHENICLVRLRNPWGKFEWTGKWSDKDTATWNAHPSLMNEVGWSTNKDTDDGGFWMSFEDFNKTFNMLGVCMRDVSQGVHGPGMPVPAQECMGSGTATGHRHIQPAVTCASQTVKWWCLGQGLKNVCWPFFLKDLRHNNDLA